MAPVNNPGLGTEYEMLFPAYLALKFIKNKKIKYFRLRSNVKGFEKFDDVLIDLEMENGDEHHLAIQLKHKERKDGKLTPESFHTGADFNLEKYCKAYYKLASDKYKSIIFTNASFDSKKIKDVKKFTMALSKDDFVKNLINTTSKNDNVYKFKINEEVNKKDFEKFSQNFFLFVAQKNTKELEKEIKNIFENEYYAEDVKISTEYINLFRKWHKREFTNDTLDRQTLSIHLVDLLLGNFVNKPSKGIINRDEKLSLLEEGVRIFDVTIIEDLKLKFVKEIGKYEDVNFLPSYIQEVVKKFAIGFKIDGKNVIDECLLRLAQEYKFVGREPRELKLREKCKIFNYLCGKPLLINYNEESQDQIAKVLKMDFKENVKIKFVLVGKKIDQTQFGNLKIFKTLQHLRSRNNSLYQKIINETDISLEGRKKIKLEKIVVPYPQLIKIIQVKHLCQEDFKVGKELEQVPKYYIPRGNSFVLLNKSKFLKELIKENHLLVINYGTEEKYIREIAEANSKKLIDIDKFINKNSKNSKQKYIVVTKETEIKDKFDKICNMTYGNVSFLKINKEQEFILIKSKNDEIKGTFLNETQTLINFCDGINVLCTEPGMGKTSSMKNFRNKCSSDQWKVFLELGQFGFLFGKNEFKIDEILDHFFKKADEDVIASEMRNIYLKKKRIVFFLDGLDELDSKCIDNALIFVKQLKEKGFTVWLSSRNNIQDKIETELNLFSIDIKEVNQEEQKKYINSRMKPYNYTENEIKQIIDNIFDSVGIQNNASILGIPLQLFMLTQIFIDDKCNSNENNSKLIEKQFILTKLYKKYFEGKIKHLLQKNGLKNESIIKETAKLILKKYQISALRSCLDEENFNKLNLNQNKLEKYEKFINEIKDIGDKYGVIKNVNEEKTVTFVHHTHAEYFAAIYLSKHFDKVRILGESFLSQKYNNLRLLFDIKLAEDAPLHLSVIYRNLDQFYGNIRKGCNVRDKGGRTALHLACVYATKYSSLDYQEYVTNLHFLLVNKYPNIRKENDSLMKIIDKLVELCPVVTKDEIFEWDEIDYAIKCWSLYPLEAILRQQQYEIINFAKYTVNEKWKKNFNENKMAMAYYSTRLGYQHLLKIVLLSCEDEPIPVTLFLDEACAEGHKEIVHLLLTNHATKADVSTALVHACKKGHIEIADLLIRNNADVNNYDSFLNGPLHDVCRRGHTELARLLIQNKADVNIENSDVDTPLHLACEGGHKEIAHLLIQNNANVNQVNVFGNTPLHGACSNGHTEIALLLIQNNAKVNMANEYLDTPLHLACKNGYHEIGRLLIQNNADVKCFNYKGYTPLKLAQCME